MRNKHGLAKGLLVSQKRTPYVTAVIKYVKENRIPFHMPGHKQGRGVDHLLKSKNVFGESVFRYDLTEVDGLDYLNSPNGVILEAEKLAAKAFGSFKTYFLVNGSTVGNIAAILASVKEGEKIIVARNSHRSTTAGLILSGAVPIYAQPTLHPPSGLYPVTSRQEIARLLQKNRDVTAVHITSPTHVGFVSDIRGIREMTKKKKNILIVDEAHGAHFPFHPSLPESSIRLGADLVVQSVHKTLSSFTQTSMLHLNKNPFVEADYLEQILSLLQSSSPSTLLVMSLDMTRKQMAQQGFSLLERTLKLADKARREINSLKGFHCYGEEVVGTNDIVAIDRTKLLIDVSESGYTGTELERLLGRKYKIEIEMSDERNILCFVTIGDSEQTINSLISTLRSISLRSCANKNIENKPHQMPEMPKMIATPKEAFFAPKRRLDLRFSLGKISGEFIIPFPPDIPLIVPGEMITKAILNHIDWLKEKAIPLIGPSDKEINTILVLK